LRFARLAALATLALVLAAPLVGEAQPGGQIHRIGLLGAASATAYASHLAALRQGLRDLGYDEGRNLLIEYRWAEGQYQRFPDLAAELVARKVTLIVTHGTPGAQAALQATSVTPVVMATVGDPVESGLVTSLARPGKNVTGSTFFNSELAAKRLEFLKEINPRTRRVAVLLNPDNPVNRPILSAMEATAAALGLELQQVATRDPDQLDSAFAAMVAGRADATVVIDDALLLAHARRIADLAVTNRLPSAGFKEYAVAGGLMAYAANFPVLWRRAATFVDKILKGTKPDDLPIERATHFELIINRKTAKALGLTIPPAVLARADEIIQ
jgi:putative tryptophan/tyrosine transport system substrate-binding protein